MADIVTIPLYDPVIAGNPFYIVLIMFMGAFIIMMGVAFYTEVYVRLKPVWKFRTADRENTPISIITGMNHKIWMETTEYVAGIFRSLELPLMWILTSTTAAGQMGKVNTTFVGDDWNIVHDQEIDYAIVYAVRKWNEGKNTEDVEFITDWETFELHLMNSDLDRMFPEGIKIPPLRIVNTHEIKRYLPKWAASHHAGYINQEVVKRETKDKEDSKKQLYFLAGGGLLMLALCALGYVLITSAKCQG